MYTKSVQYIHTLYNVNKMYNVYKNCTYIILCVHLLQHRT